VVDVIAERERQPLACVLGNVDVVRALGLAGIRCALVARPDSPARYSRFTAEFLDSRRSPGELVGALLEFSRRQSQRPVLFYSADWNLRLVSRFRDRLNEGFHFVVPEADLVESLLDKSQFDALAAKLGLPVPRAQALFPGRGSSPTDVRLQFPLVLKPLLRDNTVWAPIASTKAIALRGRSDLEALWPRLEAQRLHVIVQEVVEGPESRLESYHVYVDRNGDAAAEFTGRKIRTHPREFGYSSAITITDTPDLVDVGRDVVAKLGLRGVAKLDFKRGRDGTLHLLEVNPRFNLWHHPGARAGVNIPELVYRDLLGLPRPQQKPLRVGVCWCSIRHDRQAAKDEGIGLMRWLVWAMRCEIKSPFAWHDPLPLFGSAGWRALHSRRFARLPRGVARRRRAGRATGAADAAAGARTPRT
jgi:D-aspartate ligase